jgi:hypothetical protein
MTCSNLKAKKSKMSSLVYVLNFFASISVSTRACHSTLISCRAKAGFDSQAERCKSGKLFLILISSNSSEQPKKCHNPRNPIISVYLCKCILDSSLFKAKNLRNTFLRYHFQSSLLVYRLVHALVMDPPCVCRAKAGFDSQAEISVNINYGFIF